MKENEEERMNNQESLLTVIVPVYNVEKYILKCLDSLRYQSYQNFKVIIVDDGSKDNGGKIAKEYAEEYPKMFTYLYQENAGQGAARNAGLKYVNTSYILFLDSDDWLMPRTIERIEKLLKFETEEPDIIFMTPKVYDMATKKYLDWTDNERLKHIFSQKHVTNPRETPDMYALEASLCRSVWNTNFLRKHHFSFPEGIKWEDVFPHFYLFYWARRCVFLPEAGFCYRINSGNQTTSLSSVSRKDIVPVFAETLAYALENKWSKCEIVYIIDMMMLFIRWSVFVANSGVRKELIEKLHKLCEIIPKEYIKAYKDELKPSGDMKIYLFCLRKSIIYKLLKNAHVVECGEKMFHKLEKVRRIR